MSVFIPCSKFIQPDTSQYALAFAKLTAQFLLLPSYNYRLVSVWGTEKKSADVPFWFRACIFEDGVQFASLCRPTHKICLYIDVCCNLFQFNVLFPFFLDAEAVCQNRLTFRTTYKESFLSSTFGSPAQNWMKVVMRCAVKPNGYIQ